jgi:DNA adenine methylase
MQYLGGKSRIAKQIAGIIQTIRQKDQLYVEPFIGSCSVFHLTDNPKEGYDNSEDLILLWQAIQNGWIPPVNLSEEEYCNLKVSSPLALRAFAGFGCSFGGKFFGGYARQPGTGYNFARGTHNSLIRKRKGVLSATIEHKDYRELHPDNAIIYCDPPYANTTQQYGNKGGFNSEEFWQIAKIGVLRIRL